MAPYKHYGLLAIVILMLMVGCSSPHLKSNLIEEIAPVVFWSVDKGTEGKLKISTLVPPLIQEQKRLLSKEVDLLKQGSKELTKQENQDYYLYRMLKHYEAHNQGEMSIVNIHEYMKKLYSPLKDPILPVFHSDKNNFNYVGTAFFRKDKEVMVIQDVEDEIFQLLDNDHF